MNRDDFIITVYCLVCEHYQALADRRPGCKHSHTERLADLTPSLPWPPSPGRAARPMERVRAGVPFFKE
jgi:hypothetical protein